MYIGNTGARCGEGCCRARGVGSGAWTHLGLPCLLADIDGLHHMIYEVLDNAIDEAQEGHATEIHVEMDTQSGWVQITDNGRGIPTNVHPKTGKSTLETVLTVLHAGEG